ncbi:MAG: preprotein translocase subunit YajC [Bacteroides sp.]|nr:preprotein translocase subunit YajC [Bacteroides sp.]MCM1447600.1 preprotein translocase subunit YajC [Bacteroides sp.]MCM1516407.1 preprotein translocase subunit YajC [Paraprevotella sp.]
MIQIIATQSSSLPMIAMWVLIGVIFWFFIFRPQRKRQQEIQNFRNSIAVGSKVVTAGGIHGEVRSIDEAENVLVIEIAKGVNIRVDRNSVYATAQTNQNR